MGLALFRAPDSLLCSNRFFLLWIKHHKQRRFLVLCCLLSLHTLNKYSVEASHFDLYAQILQADRNYGSQRLVPSVEDRVSSHL